VQQCKLSINATDFLRVAATNLFDGLVNGHVEDCVASRIEKVYESFDICVVVHGLNLNLNLNLQRTVTRLRAPA
jgi:hypothetical protein